MIGKPSGAGFVTVLAGLVVGLLIGWLLLVPPGAVVVDDVTTVDQLSSEQVERLVTVLDEGGALPSGGLLVDRVSRIDQLSTRQVERLVAILHAGGALPTTGATRPASPGVVRTENPCCWPETCWPRPARELLDEIRTWVDEAGISEALRDDLVAHLERCLDPLLTRVGGTEHVCTLSKPDACSELRDEVWAAAEAAVGAGTEEAWRRVREELEDFPSGR